MMPITVTASQILQMVRFRHGKAVGSKLSIIRPLAAHWQSHVVPAGIADNPRRASHFLAQIAHETGHFKTLTEYASGEAYDGRRDLGNVHAGDGPRFKGRGYLQLTGRAGYARIGDAIAVDLEGDPGLAATPEIAVRAAVAIWRWKRLVPGPSRDSGPADGDDPSDVKAVTRAINGGTNGYADRLAYYRAARRIWRHSAAPPAAIPGEPAIQERAQALMAELKALTGAKDVSLIFD